MNTQLLGEIRNLSFEACSKEMASMQGVNLIDFSIMLAVHGHRQYQIDMLRRMAAMDYVVMVQGVTHAWTGMSARGPIRMAVIPPPPCPKSGGLRDRKSLLVLVGGATLQPAALTGKRPDND